MSVLIFLGGSMPSPALAKMTAGNSNRIIAADSGYDTCHECGIVPHIVTGDFDSIQNIPDDPSVEVVPSKEQDATDFEKALRHVPENENFIEILGGTGLRADHFLTNLLIAAGQPPQRAIVFLDDRQSITRITPSCPYEATVSPDTVVSLIPFTNCKGVTTKGLHWNLDNAQMGPASQLGQSNRAADAEIKITIKQGILFAIINLR